MAIDVRAGRLLAGTSTWAIGEPGRAALEVRAGPPAPEVGHCDIAISSADLPGIAVLAASSRGLLHRARGGVRQDAFALSSRRACEGGGELVAVVCDGVGSLGRSHEAADLVARVLAAAVADGQSWHEAFRRANEDVTDLARQRLVDSQPADAEAGMATTVVGLVVSQADGYWAGELAWVGDSSCWHLARDGTWAALGGVSDDEEDAYHTGAVSPLPSRDGQFQTASFRVEGGALFLMTDGVANPLRWSEDVQLALAAWWEEAPDPLTFAAQVAFARKSHHDDRTVVGIWSRPSEQQP